MKKLQVLVVFEFGGIESADSIEADMVIDEVSDEVERVVKCDWQSPMSSVTAWVQDATVVEEDQ